MDTPTRNRAIAETLSAAGLSAGLVWEPAYACPNGHDNHADGCLDVCENFEQGIGHLCVYCQAPIGRGGSRDFTDPAVLFPALRAWCQLDRDHRGWSVDVGEDDGEIAAWVRDNYKGSVVEHGCLDDDAVAILAQAFCILLTSP